MPNGTLTKKIQRHPTVSVRSPPSTGPSAGATSVGIITIVAARARSIGGKARNIIATPTGVSIPPPIPCTIRNAISWPIDWAKPHIIEPITNSGERREQHSLRAEAIAEPTAGRDPHRQRERVSEDDPVDGVGGELLADRAQGDVDDRHVEDVEEQRRHEDGGDDELVLDEPAEQLDGGLRWRRPTGPVAPRHPSRGPYGPSPRRDDVVDASRRRHDGRRCRARTSTHPICSGARSPRRRRGCSTATRCPGAASPTGSAPTPAVGCPI